MEMNAVAEIFCRFEALHGVKFFNYVSGGDSKTFKSILDREPYNNFTVCKKEYIGHVQKHVT